MQLAVCLCLIPIARMTNACWLFEPRLRIHQGGLGHEEDTGAGQL